MATASQPLQVTLQLARNQNKIASISRQILHRLDCAERYIQNFSWPA